MRGQGNEENRKIPSLMFVAFGVGFWGSKAKNVQNSKSNIAG